MTLRHFGLPEMPEENYRFYVGDGLDMALKRALRDAGDPEGKFLSEGIPLCRAWFRQDPLFRVKPYPGIPEVLAKLRSSGVALAVCSNKPHDSAVFVVEQIFGTELFSVIQGQMPDMPLKPDPAGLRWILCKLQIQAGNALYFGDSDTDMLTGTAAGIFTAGVTWGFRPESELRQTGANCILHKPEEILTLVPDE